MRLTVPLKKNLPTKPKTVIAFCGRFFVILLIVFGCSTKEDIADKPIYTGPIMSLDSVKTALSDSGLVVLRKFAPKEDHFENRDTEWEKGLFLQYFDKQGNLSSTFKSDYAFYQAEANLYKGVGNVIVQNVTNGDQLNTEELFWDPTNEQFYTEKFVTIRTEDEIHTGEGLTANQDFTSYTILKPSGTFTIEDQVRTPTYEVN